MVIFPKVLCYYEQREESRNVFLQSTSVGYLLSPWLIAETFDQRHRGFAASLCQEDIHEDL